MLVLDEIADQEFELYAIHSSIEDYRLAFLLNKNLNIQLSRTREDLDLYSKSGQALFSLFSYSDEGQFCDYFLVSNTSISEPGAVMNSGSLFEAEEFSTNSSYLLPEFKKVDFFLKIEGDPSYERKALISKKLKEIAQISTAYYIAEDKIKSKENLIFD